MKQVGNENEHDKTQAINQKKCESVDASKCNKIKEQLKSISIDYKKWSGIQWLTGC